jgi:hypothetical protein
MAPPMSPRRIITTAICATLSCLLAGCTALSLERHTANQAMTCADMRYQLVLRTLARTAANPGNLPSMGTMTDGQTTISDSLSFDAKTALDAVKGFTGETLNGSASRNPSLQWTIDPVHTPEQLRAAQAACRWVVTQTPPLADSYARQLLRDFGVEQDLWCLMCEFPGWLCVGCKKDAPRGCTFVGWHGDTYVWVDPAAVKALSEFTLILANIATVDPETLLGKATVVIGFPSAPGTDNAASDGKSETQDGDEGDSQQSTTKKETQAKKPAPNGPQFGQSKTAPSITQQVHFRCDPNERGKFRFLQPLVVFGEPNKSPVHFIPASPRISYGSTAEMMAMGPEMRELADQASTESLNNRVFQSSSTSAAFNFRSQQEARNQVLVFQHLMASQLPLVPQQPAALSPADQDTATRWPTSCNPNPCYVPGSALCPEFPPTPACEMIPTPAAEPR